MRTLFAAQLNMRKWKSIIAPNVGEVIHLNSETYILEKIMAYKHSCLAKFYIQWSSWRELHKEILTKPHIILMFGSTQVIGLKLRYLGVRLSPSPVLVFLYSLFYYIYIINHKQVNKVVFLNNIHKLIQSP